MVVINGSENLCHCKEVWFKNFWYVLETQGKKIVDTLRYLKLDFDFMGEK